MNFPSEIFPSFILWLSYVAYALILFYALWKAPWHHLKNFHDSHVYYAACIVLWLVWRSGGQLTEGIEFHLLLVTSVTLMFGWQFAVLAVSLSQLMLTLEGIAQWATYALNVACNGLLPIFLSYWLYRLTYIWMPRHFFIYIYVAAFFGGALSMLASRLTGTFMLASTSSYGLLDLQPMFIIVMLFPEAFMNGLIMTALVAYQPRWVSSFNDEQYLNNK